MMCEILEGRFGDQGWQGAEELEKRRRIENVPLRDRRIDLLMERKFIEEYFGQHDGWDELLNVLAEQHRVSIEVVHHDIHQRSLDGVQDFWILLPNERIV